MATTVLIGEKGEKLRIVHQNVTMKDCLTTGGNTANIPDILSRYVEIYVYKYDRYTIYYGLNYSRNNDSIPYYSYLGEMDDWAARLHANTCRHLPRAIVIRCNDDLASVPLEFIMNHLEVYMDQNDPAYRVLKTRFTRENDVINI